MNMSKEKNVSKKTRLHPRNKNKDRYDLTALIQLIPEIKNYILPNKIGEDSVDFSNAKAVKLLNKGLLNQYYGIENWEFSDDNLCPPIPGRADYIHYVADLLRNYNFGRIPTGNIITCFDIGIGASCIYPIIGITEYGWNFIGSDIDSKSIESAKNIVAKNPILVNKVECQLQKNHENFFQGIIQSNDKIDLSICNPPFHASQVDAQKGTNRKTKNLTGQKVAKPELNFAGINTELIYEGGEIQFLINMIRESKGFSKNCYWFTSLVSKKANLNAIYKLLDKLNAEQVETIPMGTGNKISRIVAWTFLTKAEKNKWKSARWKPKK